MHCEGHRLRTLVEASQQATQKTWGIAAQGEEAATVALRSGGGAQRRTHCDLEQSNAVGRHQSMCNRRRNAALACRCATGGFRGAAKGTGTVDPAGQGTLSGDRSVLATPAGATHPFA